MAELIAFVTRLANSIMAPSPPAFPTLQGLSPELRNKIYDLLAPTETRTISCRKLLELHKADPNINKLWKQFQACITLHPLSMTCRQLHAEFRPIFATSPVIGAPSYSLIVDKIDLDQLNIAHIHLVANCIGHRISDSNVPPLLWDEVSLCLKLDSNIDQSAQAFCNNIRRKRGSLVRPSLLWGHLKVVVLSEYGSLLPGRAEDLSLHVARAKVRTRIAALTLLLCERRIFRFARDDRIS